MFETVVDREQMLDHITELLAARDRIDAELTTAVVRASRCSAWLVAGSTGARTHLRSSGGRTAWEVRDLLGLARVATLPRTATALTAGTLPVPHARILADAVTDARRDLFARDETVLLDHAARMVIRDFETLVAHWAALADQESGEPTSEPHQRLHVQGRFDGGADLRGSLDTSTTRSLLDALDAYDTGPDPVDAPAPRRLAERRADALGDIADAALGRHRDDRTPAAPRATTNVVVDLATLAGRAGAMDLDGIDIHVDGRPVHAQAIDHLLCDSWIATVTRDARGAVIDATERSAPFTDTQRRLLAVRDRGCVFPGCDRPPSWCDAHHLHHRAEAGTNALANGVLLCRRHHTLLHRGWALVRGPGGSWHATSPTGRTWTGRPPARAPVRAP